VGGNTKSEYGQAKLVLPAGTSKSIGTNHALIQLRRR
jgi:hypothetical protein